MHNRVDVHSSSPASSQVWSHPHPNIQSIRPIVASCDLPILPKGTKGDEHAGLIDQTIKCMVGMNKIREFIVWRV
jgi:hypothetical protein